MPNLLLFNNKNITTSAFFFGRHKYFYLFFFSVIKFLPWIKQQIKKMKEMNSIFVCNNGPSREKKKKKK